jgi:hypothetical protein
MFHQPNQQAQIVTAFELLRFQATQKNLGSSNIPNG